jgi:hypothetical protein
MMEILDGAYLRLGHDLFINKLVQCFQDPGKWGYSVTIPFMEDLEKMLRDTTNTEFVWEAREWCDTHSELCSVSLRAFGDRMETTHNAIQPEESASVD